MSTEQSYTELYREFGEAVKKPCAGLLNKGRDDAFERFARSGFPTTHNEDYLYTDLLPAFGIDYGVNINRLDIPVNPYEVFRCDVPGISPWLYFVVNDKFYPTAQKNILPDGVIICGLNEAATQWPELLEKYYNRLAGKDQPSTVDFNAMFTQDGFFMYVPKNVTLNKPVQLIDIMRADVDFMANSRNLIIIEEGAQAQFLECSHTSDPVQFLSNRVTEVFVGENAGFEYYALENTHNKTTNISSLFIAQEASSRTLVNSITLHNGTTRNEVRLDLNGENAETLVCGMAIGDKNQHIDNFTFVNHASPSCRSRELYKYVLDDSSTGAFAGKILVAPGAQKTEAFLTNRNLCATPTARMKTKPQLEIYADDVKCSHGATVGQLDEAALFYMRSRGIPEAEAKMLLKFAFTADVIDNIRIEALKDRIHMLVEKRFRGELSKCNGCVICQ
jgi:Fe-S cluster assembly protein SufD